MLLIRIYPFQQFIEFIPGKVYACISNIGNDMTYSGIRTRAGANVKAS
nr:MAG TPA: hypothetical protein [Caudoviricetes sp.]